MNTGKPVARQWLLMLKDGSAIIDWGDGQYQEISTGAFITLDDRQISHPAQDSDLEQLKRAGMIGGYDASNVFLLVLPEKPRTNLG